jgi:hypothetical protein
MVNEQLNEIDSEILGLEKQISDRVITDIDSMNRTQQIIFELFNKPHLILIR